MRECPCTRRLGGGGQRRPEMTWGEEVFVFVNPPVTNNSTKSQNTNTNLATVSLVDWPPLFTSSSWSGHYLSSSSFIIRHHQPPAIVVCIYLAPTRRRPSITSHKVESGELGWSANHSVCVCACACAYGKLSPFQLSPFQKTGKQTVRNVLLEDR